jgi:hypothetical protein
MAPRFERRQNPEAGSIRLHRSVTMRKVFLVAVFMFMVAWLCVSQRAIATIVTLHHLVWVQVGPNGELLITGTMGSMLSVDGGTTWTPPVWGTATESRSLAQMRADSVQEISKQHGLSWPRPQGIWPSVPAVDHQHRMYACSKDGKRVEYSDNNGNDWNATGKLDKIEFYNCRGITMIEDIPYVLTRNGIYRSEDRGQHWIGISDFFGPVRGHYAFGIARLFGDGHGLLYVDHRGTRFTGDDTMKIFRSHDQGVSWEQLVFDLSKEQAQGNIMLLRIHQNALYFVAHPGVAGAPVSLYRTTDDRTVTKLLDIPLDGSSDLDRLDIGPHGELVVVGYQSLFISTDKGTTWRTISKDALWKGPWSYHT